MLHSSPCYFYLKTIELLTATNDKYLVYLEMFGATTVF